ncbi:DUF262 domain-containing protein [Micromonospora sp. WMMD1120]|uniref:DUF262 domain-containing protein n=1 Tax=Micromonospora sp. WMMD1120 TaxID=3016106 RepID=UPI002416C616|nr:DUF262 domain-containing protein [Micromonospora sp. WMMD1120]MDG4807655.1 DUF262 domain-containing protein [Micromonospora sp. WMMD1120]
MKLEKSDLQLETIVSRINAGELDLQPDFQRGEIWDSKRRQRLVDTILREWYIPAIHIVIHPDGNEVVLDGQQRLAAIRDFFANKIVIDGKAEPDSDEIRALGGMRYRNLPDRVRRAVNRFVLPIITLTGYQPQEPNELFFRLNQSYNLTPPEKRNALHGAARNQVRDLVVELSDLGLLEKDRIGFTNGRLAYDDIVARTCVAIEVGTLRRHINNTVVEQRYRDHAFSDSTIAGVRAAGAALREQIDGSEARIKFNKGTLQTWLVYCYWAPIVTGPLPPDLLGRFERERGRLKRGDVNDERPEVRRLLELVSLYDDRASYRVTDVSSVLARDVVVHLFSQAFFDTPGRKHSSDLLNQLRSDLVRPAPALVFDYVENAGWGDPLVESLEA